MPYLLACRNLMARETGKINERYERVILADRKTKEIVWQSGQMSA